MRPPIPCPRCHAPAPSLMGELGKTCSHAHSAIGTIDGKALSLAALADNGPAKPHDSSRYLAPFLTLVLMGLLPVFLHFSSGRMDAPLHPQTEQLLSLMASGPARWLNAAIFAGAAAKIYCFLLEDFRARELNHWRVLHFAEIDSLFASAGKFHGCPSCQILWNHEEPAPKPFAWNSDSMRAAAMGGAHFADLEARDIAAQLHPDPALAARMPSAIPHARRL